MNQEKRKARNPPRLQEQTRNVLDFPTVKAFYAQKAQTAEGKRLVRQAELMPRQAQGAHFAELDQWFQATAEGPLLRFPTLPDTAFFRREPTIKPFDRHELRIVRDMLLFWRKILVNDKLTFMRHGHTRDPLVDQLTRDMEGIFDPDGHWNEHVSPIYSKLIRQYFSVEEQLEASLRAALRKHASWLNESIVYERNHRRVLAVKVDFRGRVKGIMHDYSASGNTIYIEPDETVNKQNRLTEIESEIEEELHRIRVAYSERILDTPVISDTIGPLLAHADHMQALVLTAHAARLQCIQPNDDHTLTLMDARHPFLDSAFAPFRKAHNEAEEEDNNEMVPFSLDLDATLRGLVISGANTGGKTVTLKTTGLISWLANSGFPVPVTEGSAIPFYSTILADIGDNQSLSHNLSTFASHLVNLRHILETDSNNTLVLLDELGSGTDPNEGNALGQALIEDITGRGFHLLVTTHQQILCTLAMNHPHLDNGSMAFDTRRLKPIYRFQQGVPGRSHALEIAGSAGLPASVLERARQLVDDDQVDIQAAIRNLQQQHKELHKQKQKLRRDELRLHHRIKDSREESAKLKRMQDQLREKSKDRLTKAVEKAERELRSMLSDVSSQKQRRSGMAKLATVKNQILEPFKETEETIVLGPEPSGIPSGDWVQGDRVFLKIFKKEGLLSSIDRKRARVDVDGKIFTVDSDQVIHLGKPEAVAAKTRLHDAVETEDALPFELRLLGFRVEDALFELERTLDEALRRGLPFLKIIHGHGSGALKKAVRDFLRGHDARKTYRVHLDRENDGITEVKFE